MTNGKLLYWGYYRKHYTASSISWWRFWNCISVMHRHFQPIKLNYPVGGSTKRIACQYRIFPLMYYYVSTWWSIHHFLGLTLSHLIPHSPYMYLNIMIANACRTSLISHYHSTYANTRANSNVQHFLSIEFISNLHAWGTNCLHYGWIIDTLT